MPIFHKHNFIESTNNKEMLFCSCGKTVSTHVHKWQYEGVIEYFGKPKGQILKCVACGELKKFEI